jgi:TDG/mug DNA glycosylase family protein
MSPAASDFSHSFASGFAPIAAPDANVLILGSLPSQLSLQKQEYYGNPQNAFWRVMGELFGAGPDVTYTKRARMLRQSGIAVWDVLKSSVRPGSMDAAIDLSTARPNDFPAFFDAHPDITLVCFNGKKARELYERLVAPQIGGNIDKLEYKSMPSTSPAYASMSFEEKVRQWSVVRQVAGNHRRS